MRTGNKSHSENIAIEISLAKVGKRKLTFRRSGYHKRGNACIKCIYSEQVNQFRMSLKVFKCGNVFLVLLFSFDKWKKKQVLNSAIAQFCLEIIAKHGDAAQRLCNKDPLTLKMGSYVIELFPNVSNIGC